MDLRFSDDGSKILVVSATNLEKSKLRDGLNLKEDGYIFKKKYKLGIWDGVIHQYKNNIIPVGLWYRVYQICKEFDFSFNLENKDKLNINPNNIDDIRKEVLDFCSSYYDGYINKRTNEKFFPYNHQIESVARLLKYKTSMVEVATSGGKTLILSTMIFYILRNIKADAKFLIIVPSKTLVNQFYDDIKSFSIGSFNENKNPIDIKVKEIMGADEKPRCDEGDVNVYVGTYQSLVKEDESFFKQFYYVAVDEGHQAKCISILKILMKLVKTATYRVGVSGTFPRENTAELLQVMSLLGAIVYRVPAKVLMELGLITTVKIKSLLLNHSDLEFATNVEAIKKRGGGKKAWELEKQYAQNSNKRLEFVLKKTEKIKQNSLLIFHNIEYGKRVYDYLRDNLQDSEVYFISGEVKGKKRNVIKAIMEETTGKKKILVATFGTLSTGVSINAIFNIILLDSFKSDRIITQTIGRALRLHSEKTTAIIYDLVDIFYPNCKTVLVGHYEKRKKDIYIYRSYDFEEKNILL